MFQGTQPALFGDPPVTKSRKKRPRPSKARTIEATCIVCLEGFSYLKVRRAQAFCSEQCAYIRRAYMRIVVWNKCHRCDQWFPTQNAPQKYCGPSCQAAIQSLRCRETRSCKGCTATFTARAHESRLYCTPACRYAYEHDRACNGCGTTISCNNPRQKWCTDCKGTYRRDQLIRIARQGWARLDYDLRNAYADLVRRRPCTYCGCSPEDRKMHADHAVPLSRGGSDAWHNLVPACEPCNLRKHSKTPEEFMASLGR